MNDESLLELIYNNNELALKTLLEKYNQYFRNLAIGNFGYMLNWVPLEDLMEEAYFVLVTSIRSFNNTKNASFKTFVTLCVKRKWIRLYRESKKYGDGGVPMISLDAPINEGEDLNFYDMLADPHGNNPEIDLNNQIRYHEFQEKMDAHHIRYSKEIIELRYQGYNTHEIMDRLKISERTMNNSLYRMRRILKREQL